MTRQELPWSRTVWDAARLAAFLGVSRSCVERGRARRPGQWPRATRLGGSVGYLPDDVAAWLAGRRVNAFAGADIATDLSEGLLTRQEVAARLGKGLSWFEKGLVAYPQLLPPAYRVGRLWRYAWPEVAAWLRANRM